MNIGKIKIFLSAIILLLIVTAAATQAQPRFAGDWKGSINIPGNTLPITVHLEQDSKTLTGSIDVQGTTLPLENITTASPDSVFFEFVTSVNTAHFKGALQGDSIIAGQFLQAGYTFPFQLQRGDIITETAKNDTVPLPYHRKDLTIKNDSITIGGTLTWPKETDTKTLVIMISGSGAQDRDETLTPVSDFKPFALLADSLTAGGVATFRYDDRGVGASTGSFGNATLSDLTSDVNAVIHYFKNESEHRFDRILLLGHSQGGVVGGNVAAENTAVDGLILMASTGVPLKDVMEFQVRQAFEQAGINSALIEQEIKGRKKLMRAVLENNNISEAQKQYQHQFEALQHSAGVDSAHAATLAEQQTQKLTAAFRSSQLRSLLYYDPTTDLKKLDIPVLVLFGGKDTQVAVAMNKPPIKEALAAAKTSHKIIVFDHANHLFQRATTGTFSEYGSLPNKFINGFTRAILTWVDHPSK